MSRCGFSSLNRFWALNWSRPRSHPKRRSIATCTQAKRTSSLLESCRRVRLHKCHGIRSERLGLPPGLLHAVVSHRTWFRLRTTTVCPSHDRHPLHCAFSMSQLCPSECPDPGLVALEPHPAPLCSHGPDLSGRLSSNGFVLLPSWRFQLRVVHGILRSVLVRASSARQRHPRHPSVNPYFMISALLMYRRRVLPIASASAIAVKELTSGNTTRTSFALLSPSQGLAVTVFRKVRSNRSVASRRLTVRTLCMPLCVPT